MLSASRLCFRAVRLAAPGAKFRPPSAAVLNAVRFYSQSTSFHVAKKDESSNSTEGQTVVHSDSYASIFPKFLQPYLPTHSRGWVMLGSGVVAFGVSRVFYNITYSFLGLTPAASLYYGFMGGLVTAASGAMVVWWGDQTFRVAPERAVTYSLELLNKSSKVTELMGGYVITNNVVRSYSIVHSQIGFKGILPRWISPYVEVVYTVKSKNAEAEAVVTCVYGKKGTSEVVDYLAIEPTASKGEKLVVIAKDATFTIQDSVNKHAAAITKQTNNK